MVSNGVDAVAILLEVVVVVWFWVLFIIACGLIMCSIFDQNVFEELVVVVVDVWLSDIIIIKR